MKLRLYLIFSILLLAPPGMILGEGTPSPEASPSAGGPVSPPSLKAGDMKFGWVDLQKVFRGYFRTEKILSQLEENQKKKEGEMEKMAEEIKKLRGEVSDTKELLSESTRAKKEREIETKTQELKQLEREVRLELGNQALDEKEKLLNEILEKIGRIAQVRGYTFIFREELLLYKDATLDLTQEVIKDLNQEKEK